MQLGDNFIPRVSRLPPSPPPPPELRETLGTRLSGKDQFFPKSTTMEVIVLVLEKRRIEDHTCLEAFIILRRLCNPDYTPQTCFCQR